MDHNTSFTERDTEALMAGRAPRDPALVPLQDALARMKETLVMNPSPEVLSEKGALFAAAVPAEADTPQARPAASWRRRVAAAVALAVVGGVGVAGAAVADEAAPGDALYGIDQALERIRILDGGIGERFDEAQTLLDQGDVDAALDLASDALERDGHDEAATGLRRAALAVASQSSGDDVRARVSAMLEWMAGEDSRGAEFGAAVSERARQLSGNARANENANENANRNANENANRNANENANKNANGNENLNENLNENANENLNENAQVPTDPGTRDRAPETAGAPDTQGGRP